MQTHNNLSNEYKLVAGVGAGFVRIEEHEGKVGKQHLQLSRLFVPEENASIYFVTRGWC